MNLSAQTFQSDSLQSVPFSLRSEFYQGFDTIPLTNTTTNSSNSCDEMKFFQKSLFKAEQNNSSLSWFGLPNNNDDKNEITKNHAALPIVSNSGYKGIACCECGCHFFQIEHYVAHLEATGHKKRSPNSKDGQGSPTSPIIPMLPIESYSYLHPPPGLTVGSPTLTRQQPVFKPTQTPPHTPHRIQGAPKKYQKPKFTLFFGAATKTDSLVGGCGWWIRDSCNTVVTHGSVPVQQPYSSLPRLEYEALLNGLIAAHVKKIRCLCIKSHCELSFLMMQGREVPGLSSVLYSVRDISTAIAKLLPQFQTLEVELINAEQNHYSQKLAKTVIDDFLRRQEKMALDKMIQLQAATETVSKHFLVEKKPTQPTQPIQPVSSLVGQSSPFVMLSPGDSRFSSFDDTIRMPPSNGLSAVSGSSVAVPSSYFDGWESSSFLDGLSFRSGTTSRNSCSTTPVRTRAPVPCDGVAIPKCDSFGGPFDLGFEFGFPSTHGSTKS